jgi:hypothetical protein
VARIRLLWVLTKEVLGFLGFYDFLEILRVLESSHPIDSLVTKKLENGIFSSILSPKQLTLRKNNITLLKIISSLILPRYFLLNSIFFEIFERK